MTAKIVIVEDNPVNMRLLEQSLIVAGYQPVTTSDGEGLVDLVVSSGASLVLMDIQLPKYSGLTLLELLRQDVRTQDIPVVAVTAFADKESLQSFAKAGFDQVLTKPLSMQNLAKQLAIYLQA